MFTLEGMFCNLKKKNSDGNVILGPLKIIFIVVIYTTPTTL